MSKHKSIFDDIHPEHFTDIDWQGQAFEQTGPGEMKIPAFGWTIKAGGLDLVKKRPLYRLEGLPPKYPEMGLMWAKTVNEFIADEIRFRANNQPNINLVPTEEDW